MKILLDKDRLLAANRASLSKKRLSQYERFTLLKELIVHVYEKFPHESAKTFNYVNNIRSEDDFLKEEAKCPIIFIELFGLVTYWFERSFIDEKIGIKAICEINENYFFSKILGKEILSDYKEVLEKYVKSEIYDIGVNFHEENLLSLYTQWNILKDIYLNIHPKYWDEVKVILEETPWMMNIFNESNFILKNCIKISNCKNSLNFNEYLVFLKTNYNLNLKIHQFVKTIHEEEIIYKIDKESFILGYLIPSVNKTIRIGKQIYEMNGDEYINLFKELMTKIHNHESLIKQKNIISYDERNNNIILTIPMLYEKIVDTYIENMTEKKGKEVSVDAIFREILLKSNLNSKLENKKEKKKL